MGPLLIVEAHELPNRLEVLELLLKCSIESLVIFQATLQDDQMALELALIQTSCSVGKFDLSF